MTPDIPYLGEILSLATAVIWASAVILWKKSGAAVHPIGLNTFKNTLATVLFLPLLYLVGDSLFFDAPGRDYAILLASGAIGIGIADTLFLKALNALGAGLNAIVDCLYSPSIIALSIVFLDERLTLWQVLGATMIVSAVLTAARAGEMAGLTPRRLRTGIFYGVLAMLTQAAGIVAVKPLLNTAPLVWVTEWRLIGGVAVLAVILALHPSRTRILRSIGDRTTWRFTWTGSFIGGTLGMVVWLGGMKFAQTSVAAVLNQTATIFTFVFAAIFLREPITSRRVIGIGLGVTGALLVTFY